MSPEEREGFGVLLGISVVRTAKWVHYGMPLGLAAVLFSVHVPEVQIPNWAFLFLFFFTLFCFLWFKRHMIQLFTATVNLQVQSRLYKLNSLKVHVLDSVLAVLLLICALVFVLFYKHKYCLRYLKR